MTDKSQRTSVLLQVEQLRKIFFKKNYFFFGYAGSLLLRGLFLSSREQGLLFVAVCGLLIVVTARLAGHRLSGAWASGAVARGLSSYASQGLEQRPNSCGTQA